MKLTVKNPCSVDWNGMTGTEARRFCDHCDKHVHDLSLLTEEEGRALLVTPGVCARFRTDLKGEVKFRPAHLSAAAMVLGAVLTAGPAHAGGKAADPGAQGWGDWLVDWITSVGVTQGEIGPPVSPPPVEEMPTMGAVAMIVEPAEVSRTVHNATSVNLEVVCDTTRERLAPGEARLFVAPEGSTCIATGGSSRAAWTDREATCELRGNRLVCDSLPTLR